MHRGADLNRLLGSHRISQSCDQIIFLWVCYREYACTHALGNADRLRKLIYLEEIAQQPWARKMFDFLCDAKKQADTAKRSRRTISQSGSGACGADAAPVSPKANATIRHPLNGHGAGATSNNPSRSICSSTSDNSPRTFCAFSPPRAYRIQAENLWLFQYRRWCRQLRLPSILCRNSA